MNDQRRPPEPTEAEGDGAAGGPPRRMDPELLCMSRMVRVLDEIDEPARTRVVFWLAARYCPANIVITHNSPGAAPGRSAV